MDVAFIELNFPKLYQISKKYNTFKNTIIRNRIKMFGENSLEEINDVIKYNKILEHGRKTSEYPDTWQGKAASRQNELSKELIHESYKIKTLYKIPDPEMLNVLDLLQKYFEVKSLRRNSNDFNFVLKPRK